MDNTDYILEYCKVRDVKSPEKFGNAAGWDFFIPNDLTIYDFFKPNIYGIYTNDFLSIQNYNKGFILPLVFQYHNDKSEIVKYVIQFNPSNEINNEIQIKKLVQGKFLGFIPYTKYVDITGYEEEFILVYPPEHIWIMPGSKVLIPSGIHVKLPFGIFLNAENKSGIASKRGLIKRCTDD